MCSLNENTSACVLCIRTQASVFLALNTSEETVVCVRKQEYQMVLVCIFRCNFLRDNNFVCARKQEDHTYAAGV
jgi:hypothetical protein